MPGYSTNVEVGEDYSSSSILDNSTGTRVMVIQESFKAGEINYLDEIIK